MNQHVTLRLAACLGALAVIVGAFGAHGLEPTLESLGTKHIYELASRYHFYHVFALLMTGILMSYSNSKRLGYAAICFVIGMLFFCGSLYTMSLIKLKFLGPITPIGGVFLILGWVFVALGIQKK